MPILRESMLFQVCDLVTHLRLLVRPDKFINCILQRFGLRESMETGSNTISSLSAGCNIYEGKELSTNVLNKLSQH